MKKSFLLYIDNYLSIEDLTLEQKGMLLDSFFKFHMGEDVEIEDVEAKRCFKFFKQNFLRDHKKYIEKCNKNRENVKKRWNKKNTNVCERMRTDTKHTDIDNDIDNENDIRANLEKIIDLSTKSFK